MTLQQACRQAAKAFAAAGIPDPAWDSGLLMERATGIPPLMARLSQRELTEAEHSTLLPCVSDGFSGNRCSTSWVSSLFWGEAFTWTAVC